MNQPNESGESLPSCTVILRAAVHDMRTPLSSMLTSLEILRQLSQGSAPAIKCIELLERQVMTLSEQLDCLLRDPASFVRQS